MRMRRQGNPRKKHTLRRFLLLSVCLLAGFYFFQVTTAMGRGTELKKLNQQQTALREETKRLELNIAEQNSLYNLQQRLEALHLTVGGPVEYIHSSGDGSVAIK